MFLRTIFCFVIAFILSSCGNEEKYRAYQARTAAKLLSIPTSPALSAFDKICIDNAFSIDAMKEAAKHYTGQDLKLQDTSRHPSSRPHYRGNSSDNKIAIAIYPNGECKVTHIDNKPAISVLFTDAYDDLAKSMDMKLGLLLMKKYGAENIKIERVAKYTNHQITQYGPIYIRHSGSNMIKYNLDPFGFSYTYVLSHD